MPARAAGLGFTLIELMVVVGIVGILAVVGMPAMRDMVVSNRMKTLSLDIYTSLSLARSEAIKRNSNNVSMIAASGGWQNGWTVCVDDNADGDCDTGEAVVITGDAVDNGITLSGPAGPARVTFNRDGRLSTAAASFRIVYTANNAQVPMRCVELSVSGRPKTLADSNATDSDGCQ
jgi:type IV fimbrial biogenesis protein FimT